MTTLNDAVALAAGESGLAVVSTVRADGSVQASLVNVGLLPHPAGGQPSLGFTTYGKVKLANLRARPQLAITFKNGWQWATVEGRAELAGPDDAAPSRRFARRRHRSTSARPAPPCRRRSTHGRASRPVPRFRLRAATAASATPSGSRHEQEHPRVRRGRDVSVLLQGIPR